MASNEDARAAREAKLDELHEKLTGAVESIGGRRSRSRHGSGRGRSSTQC
jgi:hypothetical protein